MSSPTQVTCPRPTYQEDQRFARYTCLVGQLVADLTSLPPPPPTYPFLPHQQPLHFSGLVVTFQKGSGVLASWQLSGVKESRLISSLGLLCPPVLEREGGENEGSWGSPSSEPLFQALHSSVDMLGGGGGGDDQRCRPPRPHPTPDPSLH